MAVDRELAVAGTFEGAVEKLIQGPLADALTHVGQLSMLRGMAGAPVRPESYARATVTAGGVGQDQQAGDPEPPAGPSRVAGMFQQRVAFVWSDGDSGRQASSAWARARLGFHCTISRR